MGVVRATSACDKLCLLYDLLLFLMVSIYLKKIIIIKFTDLILGRIKLMLGMVTITFPSPILYAHYFNMAATSLLKHSRLLRRICNHAGICFLRPSLQGYLISVELIGKKRNQSI